MRKKSNRTFGENKPNQSQFQNRKRRTDDGRRPVRRSLGEVGRTACPTGSTASNYDMHPYYNYMASICLLLL